MNRPLNGLGAGEATKILGRSHREYRAKNQFAITLRGSKLFERSTQGAQFRPDFGATKQLTETIDMRGEDVFADVRREMIVTDELASCREDFRDGRRQRLA